MSLGLKNLDTVLEKACFAKKLDAIMRANRFTFIDSPDSPDSELAFRRSDGLVVVINLSDDSLHVVAKDQTIYLDDGTSAISLLITPVSTPAQVQLKMVISLNEELDITKALESFLNELPPETSASAEHPWVAEGEEQISAFSQLWRQYVLRVFSPAIKHPFTVYSSTPILAALLAKLYNPQIDFNGPVGNAIITCFIATALVSSQLSIIFPPDDSD